MKIAIYGPMCSGKTTVARMIQEIDRRYEIYSFGRKIKDLASEARVVVVQVCVAILVKAVPPTF